jgi:hypothetical protein
MPLLMCGVYVEDKLHQLIVSESGNYCMYEVDAHNLKIAHIPPNPGVTEVLNHFDRVIMSPITVLEVPLR